MLFIRIDMTKSAIHKLIVEVILEALWGQKFKLSVSDPHSSRRGIYTAVASKNVKPGELPYRITWFIGNDALGHVDLTWEEINNILEIKYFPKDIVDRISQTWDIEPYNYHILPINYITEGRVINEGMSIGVSGHNYGEDIVNIGSLSWWLASNVQIPIMKKMTDDEKKTIQMDIITPDGNSYDQMSGKLNVYIGAFPEKWRPMLLGGIQHFMDKHGVIYGKWTQGTSALHGKAKVVIPIESVNPTRDPALSIHLAYGTVKELKELLGLESSDHGDENTFLVDASELIERIREYKANSEQAISPTVPAKFTLILETLLKMATWALKHGYTEISGG